jgi:predicted house-cleaning noncanonical NTP pyrophosphatase (MazG superfamily)
VKELLALRHDEVHDRESELSGFQTEILRQNQKFEVTLTEMTQRHAEALYKKLDEDARELVSERVTAEVSHIMQKVEHMAEHMMGELNDKFRDVQRGL